MHDLHDSVEPPVLILREKIVRAVIRLLQGMTDDLLLSSDDAQLNNVWEELCVLSQSEVTPLWNDYIETVMELFEQLLLQRSDSERLALWLRTPHGVEWRRGRGGHSNEGAPVSLQQIIVDMRISLLNKAKCYTNEAIEEYRGEYDVRFDGECHGLHEGGEDDAVEEPLRDVRHDDDGSLGPEAAPEGPSDAATELAHYRGLVGPRVIDLLLADPRARGTREALDTVFAALDRPGRAALRAAVNGLQRLWTIAHEKRIEESPKLDAVLPNVTITQTQNADGSANGVVVAIQWQPSNERSE